MFGLFRNQDNQDNRNQQKKVLGKTDENKTGYLHTCYVPGYNAQRQWAIASTPEEAASQAQYGRPQDRSERAYPYGTYRIETVERDRDGHFIRTYSVYDSGGNPICSTEEYPYAR